MSEPPKKIWVEHEEGCWPAVLGEEHQGTGTPYIRADIVDDLVEALKYWMNFTGYSYMRASYMRTEAALKKLEEE